MVVRYVSCTPKSAPLPAQPIAASLVSRQRSFFVECATHCSVDVSANNGLNNPSPTLSNPTATGVAPPPPKTLQAARSCGKFSTYFPILIEINHFFHKKPTKLAHQAHGQWWAVAKSAPAMAGTAQPPAHTPIGLCQAEKQCVQPTLG